MLHTKLPFYRKAKNYPIRSNIVLETIDQKKKDFESTVLHGIGVELQNLSYPQIKNLNDLLRPLGYRVIKL